MNQKNLIKKIYTNKILFFLKKKKKKKFQFKEVKDKNFKNYLNNFFRLKKFNILTTNVLNKSLGYKNDLFLKKNFYLSFVTTNLKLKYCNFFQKNYKPGYYNTNFNKVILFSDVLLEPANDNYKLQFIIEFVESKYFMHHSLTYNHVDYYSNISLMDLYKYIYSIIRLVFFKKLIKNLFKKI